MESAYLHTPWRNFQGWRRREVTNVTQARYEVRTPSAAHRAAGGRREGAPHVEILEPRETMLFGQAGPVIGTMSRLDIAQHGRASTPELESAEPAGADPFGNADRGAGATNPRVTAEELTILTLMANGLTLDSVAVRVSMSPRTLSRRLRCVCDRLCVAYPIQAIVWAARRGLI